MGIKLIVTSIFLLMSFSVWAENIATYYGQYYKTQNLNQCQNKFRAIQTKVESQPGFYILDGGCIEVSQYRYQLTFNYSHPLTKRIDRYDFQTPNNFDCYDYLFLMANEIYRYGNLYVNGFCEKNRLVLDYIDLKASMISDIKYPVQLKTQEKCYQLLKDNQRDLEQYKIRVLYNFCESYSDHASQIKYFVPRFSYISSYDISLNYFKGKKLSESDGCLSSLDDVRDNLSKTNILLASAFCAQTNALKAEKSNQEFYVYLTKGILIDPMREFVGLYVTNENECLDSVNRVISSFRKLKYNVIYGFCSKNLEKFRPEVYYLNTNL